MTTLDVNLDRIVAGATALRPLRVLMWVVAAPFIAVFFVLYFVWLVPAFMIKSGHEGWKAGEKLLKQLQVQARESAARGG